MEKPEVRWHPEVITVAAERALRDLHRWSALTRFYLAGGTGLALSLGHRRSVDLDFFSDKPFDPESLLAKIQHAGEFSLVAKSSETLQVHVHGTKVSFLGYPYPVLFPFALFSDVTIADPRDIACMKISAISSRGAKRDFVDVYIASQHYGLDHLLGLFRQKFAQANYNMVHVLKSLSYFEDAEKDPMPDMLIPVSWEDMKQFFAREAPRLL